MGWRASIILVLFFGATAIQACDQGSRGPTQAQIQAQAAAQRAAEAKRRECDSLSQRITALEIDIDRLKPMDPGAVDSGVSMAKSNPPTSNMGDAMGRSLGFDSICATINAFGTPEVRQRCSQIIRRAYEAQVQIGQLRKQMSTRGC